MRTRLKMKPGQKGTKRFLETYGDSLYATVTMKRNADANNDSGDHLERKKWTPASQPFAPNDLVPVRIAFSEIQLQETAKSLGGRWDPQAKLWFVRFDRVKGSLLERTIVQGVPVKRAHGESI